MRGPSIALPWMLLCLAGASLSGATPLMTHAPSVTAAEIRHLRVFEEPLIPLGSEMAPGEPRELRDAILTYQRGGDPENLRPFLAFLQAHPGSTWAPSLLGNLGNVYRRKGYFSKAMESWEQAWSLSKNAADPARRAVTQPVAGNLAGLYAHLGRMEKLQDLLNELDRGPRFIGTAANKLEGARRGLEYMRAHPDRAYRCGPLSLASILAWSGRPDPGMDLEDCTPKGTSLAHNLEVALKHGLKLQMVQREPGAPMVVPALVHWKAGHFAAVVESREGAFLVKDPTFGGEMWISQAALDEESTGSMLIPGGKLADGWRTMPVLEGEGIWGCGYVTEDPDDTDPYDPDELPDSCSEPGGMAYYRFHSATTSLMVEDKPILYTPPKGPALPFSVTYSQRQVGQPATFTYSNLGPKWTFGFLSYVEDDGGPAPASAKVSAAAAAGKLVRVFNNRGGRKKHKFQGRAIGGRPASDPQFKNFSTLVQVSANSYERLQFDGSREVFDLATSPTGIRKIFMTKVIDKNGLALQLNYDDQFRVTSLLDASGGVTTLSYDLVSDPTKITAITDPFGRSATFDYNPQGLLSRITDVVGIASEFTYGPTAKNPAAPLDFINALKTPYGTTTFEMGEASTDRWVTATDPLGNQERIEYHANSSFTPVFESTAPAGFANNWLNHRNTYFWDKRTMALYPGDYSKAKVYHWLHLDVGSVIDPTKESMKFPDQSRVWYAYPNQPGGATGSLVVGSLGVPSRTVRILPDGTQQETKATYDSNGRMATSTDAMGRETTYTYSADGMDLLEVRNTTGGASEKLSGMAYDGNHRPLSVTDSAGQKTAYTYNGAGQVATIINPKGETTTFGYDGLGYLTSITGAVPGAKTTFTYDAAGRVHTATGPDGLTLTTDYDDLNRPTTVTYPDGTFEQKIYDKLEVTASRDRRGRWTTMKYSPLRQLVEVQDSQGRITRLDWCGCGNQLESLTDPLGHHTTWIRDLNGRVVSKVLDDLKGASYAYDSAGRLASRLDAKGRRTLYDYFPDGALKLVSYPDSGGKTPAVAYSYDPKYPRLSTMLDGLGTTLYTYYPVDGTAGSGRLKTVTGPFPKSAVTYSYDTLGRVAVRDVNGSAETRSFDALGRLVTVVNPLGTFTYTYDGLTARLLRVDYPNGQKTAFAYEDALKDFRLKAIQNRKADNSNISTFGYTYDVDGQITAWSQAADAALPRTYAFDYDGANQLTSAILNGPNGELIREYGYGYDLAGNRTSESVDGATTTAAHNSVNQLTGQRYSLNEAAIQRREARAAAQVQRLEASRTAAKPPKALQDSKPRTTSSQPTGK